MAIIPPSHVHRALPTVDIPRWLNYSGTAEVTDFRIYRQMPSVGPQTSVTIPYGIPSLSTST